LKPAERLVIDLLHLQGKTLEETAQLTGWSRTVLKVRAFRARQKLKTQLARLNVKESHV
jgi:RNA polymerase sigma-70 factor (ECF subfamily)